MQDLQTFVDLIENNRKIHISILDVSGILGEKKTDLSVKNIIHSKKFCDIAKSTKKGYKACLTCKALSTHKAVKSKEPFSGQCIYGLCEAVMPVVINGKTSAIIYVGNAVADEKSTKECMKKSCRCTGVSYSELEKELAFCEKISSYDDLDKTAEIVCDYLKMLYDYSPKKKTGLHWIVESMKKYAEKKYCYNILIKEFAVMHRMNGKYIGRLFKKEVGVTFNEYCNRLKIKKAERLLHYSNKKIIDILLDCGFNSESYFNKLFYKTYKTSPTKYRKKILKNNTYLYRR